MTVKESIEKLSPKVENYFTNWISRDTCYTGSLYDMERFYQFVKAVKRFSKKPPTECFVRELIVKHGGFEAKYLEKKAAHFGQLYVTLFEYENTQFPVL